MHTHDDECRALLREWQRYDRVAADAGGHLDANTVANAHREREMFARQLRAIDCSPEAAAERARRDD